MKREFNIGDRVICSESGVIGKVISFYFPTASEEQTMVDTNDGRQYHAPTRMWKKYVDGNVTKKIICDECLIPDVDITDPEMLGRHMAYLEKFARNHGLTKTEASNHPMIKAHAVFCAESHPDIFKNYMQEGC